MTNQPKAQVLVVEDDRDIRESLVEVLEDHGFSVAQAGDGREALEVLGGDSPKPDLIVLDLMMPNMNGFQFREAQLEVAAYAAIPIIVITADGNAKEKAAQLQANGFVRKPFRIQPFLEVVRQVLAGGEASA